MDHQITNQYSNPYYGRGILIYGVNVTTPINPDLVRQEALKLILPRAVAVIGVGGVGSWLSYFLALAGVPKLYLFDHDTVSDSNLNRLPVPRDCINKSKSESMMSVINALRPACDIYPMANWTPEVANGLELAKSIDWLAVTTDTLASRQSAYKWATTKSATYTRGTLCGVCNSDHTERAVGDNANRYTTFCMDCSEYSNPITHIRYIEAAAEGEFGSATGCPAEWASELEKDPGYASVPVWVGPCVIAAYFASVSILHNKPPADAQIRMGWDPTTTAITVHQS